MALTLSEIKDLLAYGRELGLQQLQTEGLVAVYGPRQAEYQQPTEPPSEEDHASILAHYSAVGRSKLGRQT